MTAPLLFIMSSTPHASAAAREGLDAILAASAVSEDIQVIFEGKGVLQLRKGQAPQAILQRHIEATYKMLDLYDVEQVYIDQRSLERYGLCLEDLAIPAEALSRETYQQLLCQAHSVLRF